MRSVTRGHLRAARGAGAVLYNARGAPIVCRVAAAQRMTIGHARRAVRIRTT